LVALERVLPSDRSTPPADQVDKGNDEENRPPVAVQPGRCVRLPPGAHNILQPRVTHATPPPTLLTRCARVRAQLPTESIRGKPVNCHGPIPGMRFPLCGYAARLEFSCSLSEIKASGRIHDGDS